MIFNRIYNIHFHAAEQVIRLILEESCNKQSALKKLQLSEALNWPITESLDSKEMKTFLEIIEQNKTLSLAKRNHKEMAEYALSKLEKQWLKTILLDPRANLFDIHPDGLEDVEPLYNPNDIVYYDRPQTSDPWNDEAYIQNFKTIYRACKSGETLTITWSLHHTTGGLSAETLVCATYTPQFIEYDASTDGMIFVGKSENNEIHRIPIISIQNLHIEPHDEYRCEDQTATTHPNNCRILDIKQATFDTSKTAVALIIKDIYRAQERALNYFAQYERKDLVCLSKEENTCRLEFYCNYETDKHAIINAILALGCAVRVESPNDLFVDIRDRFVQQKRLLKEFNHGIEKCDVM